MPNCIYKEEKFKSVSYLEEFYKENEKNLKLNKLHNKFALNLQLEFLKGRFENEKSVSEIKNNIILLDRCIYEDYHIFAKTQKKMGLINEKEFEEYKIIYDNYIKFINPPNCFFYLKTSTDKLLERIKTRGNDYEQGIEKNYLDHLSFFYDKFFENKLKNCEFFVINTDILNSEEVLEKCLDLLTQKYN